MPLLRRAVRRSYIASAAAFTLAMLAAACGTSASPSSAVPASTGGATGTINWEWELPTSWDPVTSSAGWDVHVLGLVYASITTLDPARATSSRGSPRPGRTPQAVRA